MDNRGDEGSKNRHLRAGGKLIEDNSLAHKPYKIISPTIQCDIKKIGEHAWGRDKLYNIGSYQYPSFV